MRHDVEFTGFWSQGRHVHKSIGVIPMERGKKHKLVKANSSQTLLI